MEPQNPDQPPPINEVLVSRVARDVARDLLDIRGIAKAHGLTVEQYHALVDTPIFQRRLLEEDAVWGSNLNTKERIAAKSSTIVEESLAEMYAMIHDRTAPMAARVAAIKLAADFAGIGENAAIVNDGSDRVRINIHIGERTVTFDNPPALPPRVIDGDAVAINSVL